MKKTLMIFIAILMMYGTTACSFCRHEWQEATCTAPCTCKLCGETEGEPIPHDYEDTTCIAQKPCKMCGTYDGMVLTHEFRADGKVCLLCGLDLRTPTERFAENLSAGLSENFRLGAEDWQAGFDAEYAQQRETDFDDETLAFWAGQYYDNLDAIHDALSAYGTDAWAEVYDGWLYLDHAQILYHLNELLVLEVEDADAFAAVLADGADVEAVGALCETVDFHNISGTTERQTYEALVENTTAIDFKEFSLELELADADGAVVEEKTVTVKNWKRGTGKHLRFTTSARFQTITVKYANWVEVE